MAFQQQERRRRANPRRRPDLPQYYYHTHFCDMLDFVEARYTHVFDDEHFDFLNSFRELPVGAQCLYVRFAGRKSLIFDTLKLAYPEIPNIPAAMRALEISGFISGVGEHHFPEFLNALTKPALIAFMTKHICASAFKRSWKKGVLVETALSHVPYHQAVILPNFITQGRGEALRYITYLYFGKIEDNLQKFTLRDLGLVKTPDFKSEYSARFDTAQEAQAAYFYADALHKFRHGSETDITDYIDTLERWPKPECNISIASRDKLLQKLGGLSERLGDIDTALNLYAQSDAPLCNERVIRLRYARGNKKWCKARLEALIDNPGSDEECNFAEDFYARKFKKKRTSQVTDILRSGQVLTLDEAFRNQPERAAKRYYEAQGHTVYFTENGLWRSLFGLLFWDELFLSDDAALHSSFEKIPASLKTGQFYDRYQNLIEKKLDALSSPQNIHIQILKTISLHYGTPNGIFRWNGSAAHEINALISVASAEGLADILRHMAQNYKSTKDGFPDLMLIQGRNLRFVEVKAAGDVVRRNQLTRIKQLRAAGLNTDIARIEWTVDPNQIYVVVDVETTGGRSGLHRVTEIGAVKIQGGKEIDEFQTLLNPQRPIPANITRLTGITNEMVAGAPLFSEVADEFRQFMGDAIFAAHNVNFDYGFISSEFSRLSQSFRHPKICTCSSMRKFYPGYRSYSLKNLCREFDVNLTSHHRALCDAKAAAELLFLVNEKRGE